VVAGLEKARWRRWLPSQQSLTHRLVPDSRYVTVVQRAALVAAAGLIAASCSSGRHRAAPSTAPAPPPTAATTTTTTTVPLAASPYTWVRASSPVLARGGGPTSTLAAVVTPSVTQRWLIAGTRTDTRGQPTATVWTSATEATWTAAPLPSPGTPSEANAAAEYRGSTIVVGSVGSGADRRAAVWISSGDGGPWQAVPVAPSGGESYMTSATAGALGFFAAGRIGSHVAFWSSTDGAHWSESTGAERVIGAASSARVNALLAVGTTVYAAGSVDDGAFTAAALWASSDGINWHPVLPAPSSFSGPSDRMITSLAPLGTGLVAAGAVASGSSWQPASWISPNGVSWSQPSLRFPLPGYANGAVAEAVAGETTLAGTSNLYAVGGSSQHQYLWHSTNGLEWIPVALPGAAAAAAAWQPTLVAVYQGTTVLADSDPGQPHVLVDTAGRWSEPSAVPATFGAVQPFAYAVAVAATATRVTAEVTVETPSQAVGTDTTATLFLTSTDTQAPENWAAGTAADLTDRPSTLPVAGAITTRFLGEWVAVAPAGPRTTSLPGSTGAALSWTSPTGVRWTAGGPLTDGAASSTAPPTTGALSVSSPPSGATGGVATAKAAVPNGLCVTASPAPRVIAVGTTSSPQPATGARAWVSREGVSWETTAVQPAAVPGAVEQMVGCAATATSEVAYGSSTPAGAGPESALWRSSGAAVWSRQPVAGLGPGSPYPIDSLAMHGSTWLATAGLPAGAGPTVPSSPAMVAPGWGGPGAYRLSGPDLGSLLVSSDGGATWAGIPTTGAPWSGTAMTELSSVVFAGATPIVFGTVDGQLAVWFGVLASATS
jgi:hypothetical protein